MGARTRADRDGYLHQAIVDDGGEEVEGRVNGGEAGIRTLRASISKLVMARDFWL